MSSEAWKILQEHGPAAYALLVRLTLRRDVAEELLQDLFVKLGAGGNGAALPGAYVRRAAVNLAMDWRRRRRREARAAGTLQPPARPGAAAAGLRAPLRERRVVRAGRGGDRQDRAPGPRALPRGAAGRPAAARREGGHP